MRSLMIVAVLLISAGVHAQTESGDFFIDGQPARSIRGVAFTSSDAALRCSRPPFPDPLDAEKDAKAQGEVFCTKLNLVAHRVTDFVHRKTGCIIKGNLGYLYDFAEAEFRCEAN